MVINDFDRRDNLWLWGKSKDTLIYSQIIYLFKNNIH